MNMQAKKRALYARMARMVRARRLHAERLALWEKAEKQWGASLSSLMASTGRAHYYTLDENGLPLPCFSLLEWSQFFAQEDRRRVAWDDVGNARVSTVFLGLDHSFYPNSDPVLWETMVFEGEKWSDPPYCERYTTRADALKGHAEAVERLRRFPLLSAKEVFGNDDE